MESCLFAKELHDNLADRFRCPADGRLARLAYVMTPARSNDFQEQRSALLSLNPFLPSRRMAQRALLADIVGLAKRIGALAQATSRHKFSRTLSPLSSTTSTPKALTRIPTQSPASRIWLPKGCQLYRIWHTQE
jgi:hypothetical protein